MSILSMAEMARRECLAARKHWKIGDNWLDPEAHSPRDMHYKNIRSLVVPYIGSGRTQRSVANELGVRRQDVWEALKQLGATL